MRAMILAAGLGKRMRPLTNKMPKPMLEVNGKPLIQYHVENLVRSEIVDIVINHAVFGDQIEAHLGDGTGMGARIVYSPEGDTPLGTAGGILAALPLLGREPFLVVNADIWTDFPFRQLDLPAEDLAHIILVDNPSHNLAGDFCLEQNKLLLDDRNIKLTSGQQLTFSGISIFTLEFFADYSSGNQSLASLLRQAAPQGRVSASHYHGEWYDIGTLERLHRLRQTYQA